jgi:hypothetical protein
MQTKVNTTTRLKYASVKVACKRNKASVEISGNYKDIKGLIWTDMISPFLLMLLCLVLFYTSFYNGHWLNKKAFVNSTKAFCCCRGRDRTSTRQLAEVQSSVVDPGRNCIAATTALCFVYPVILTLETRGHVCQKFHHPTVCD